MKKFLFTAVLLFSTPVFLTGQQELKLEEISFFFESKEVQGSIGDFRSSSSINTEDITKSVFEGSVSTESLTTSNFLRDWSLKNRKYFNESQYPRIHFKSTGVSENPEGIIVEGLLTLKGTTKPLTIYFKREDARLIGSAELFTSDYGIQIKKKREENKVRIAFAFELEE